MQESTHTQLPECPHTCIHQIHTYMLAQSQLYMTPHQKGGILLKCLTHLRNSYLAGLQTTFQSSSAWHLQVLTHLEYFINLAKAELPLAVQFVDVYQLTVNEEDGESNYLKWINPVNDITKKITFLHVTYIRLFTYGYYYNFILCFCCKEKLCSSKISTEYMMESLTDSCVCWTFWKLEDPHC